MSSIDTANHLFEDLVRCVGRCLAKKTLLAAETTLMAVSRSSFGFCCSSGGKETRTQWTGGLTSHIPYVERRRWSLFVLAGSSTVSKQYLPSSGIVILSSVPWKNSLYGLSYGVAVGSICTSMAVCQFVLYRQNYQIVITDDLSCTAVWKSFSSSLWAVIHGNTLAVPATHEKTNAILRTLFPTMGPFYQKSSIIRPLKWSCVRHDLSRSV